MPNLAQIYTGLTGYSLTEGALHITPWVTDSRLVTSGAAFVACPGAQTDGHLYIAEALKRGATVVIAERERTDLRGLNVQVIDLANPQAEKVTPPVLFLTDDSLQAMQKLAAWWRLQANPNLKVIGVTGSVGKTTVKELTAAILSKRFRTWKSHGNYNSDIGLPLTFLDMPLDTERAVVEMGMTRAGEITELAEIVQPTVGIVTNVGPAHAEYLGTIEAIAEAKAELVASLPANGTAILNGDDEWVNTFSKYTSAKVFMYGLEAKFDLWADQISSLGLNGISFRFHHGREQLSAKLPLLGRHSVHAALAAASVGLNEGQSWAEIIAGLKDLPKMEVLRIVVVEGLNDSIIIDDTYNASPDSVMAALNLLADLRDNGRCLAVLGDMRELGEYTEQAHKLVAHRAANVAELFVAIGEQAELMAKEAQIAGLPPEAIFKTSDRQDAANWLAERLQPGDYLLVKASRSLRLDLLVSLLSVPSSD